MTTQREQDEAACKAWLTDVPKRADRTRHEQLTQYIHGEDEAEPCQDIENVCLDAWTAAAEYGRADRDRQLREIAANHYPGVESLRRDLAKEFSDQEEESGIAPCDRLLLALLEAIEAPK